MTGVDISAAQIALARTHVPEATLIHSDMMKLELEEESFNAVVAFYSIMHLPKDEQREVFTKVTGWLKEDGRLLCNLHAKEGDVVFDDWMGAKMFSSGLGVDETRKVLSGTKGLRIIKDEVDTEKVGPFEEQFHWIYAQKGGQ